MDARKIKQIHSQIKKHQATIIPTPREIPVGAGKLTDDLTKVQHNEIIGKGGESDLRK